MAIKKTKKTAPVDIHKLVSEAAFPNNEQEIKAVKPKAAKKTAVKKAPAAKKAAATQDKASVAASYVVIDYPTEGEIVSGLAYVMRLGASADGSVEVSVNGADWSPCRHAAGFWWFDWGYYVPGPHKITARLIDATGKVLKTSIRKCTVI